RVESAIVRLRPREDRPEVDERIFVDLTRGLFSQRRKKVKKSLAAMGISSETISHMESDLLEKRPENLTPEEVVSLAEAISRNHRTGSVFYTHR
ncbi:MAG: rRNA adenine N-6-methyltransferase family protein, partial [Methanotrichaceae archaeon]